MRAPAGGSEPIRILLVDDDEDDYVITRDLLEEAGTLVFAIEWVQGYDAALTSLARGGIHICLLDYRLGERDGLDFLCEPSVRQSRVPIIVLTGLAEREVDLSVMQAGAVDFLVKGELTASLLERAIRYTLERSQSEERLLLSEAKYRGIFESIQDIYFEVTYDGIILDLSPSVKDIAHYSREELIGQHLSVIYADPAQREPFLKAIGERGRICDYELQLKDRHGTIHPCSITARLSRDDDGTPLVISGIIRDITERKKAARERQAYESRLRQVQKMEAIGTLAGGIAHDFNNILSAIIGYSELVMDDLPPGGLARENLAQVLKAGTRARDLVYQILTFSRQVESERRPIQIHPVVREAMQLLRSSIPSTIEIVQHTDPTSGTILADPTQIHQVVMNLCTNAFQAMEGTGGTLQVDLAPVVVDARLAASNPRLRQGAYVRLSVSDTGSGMDGDTLEHIFEPFFTTKDPGKGTGLGLATTHGIVTGLGGDISVESEPGRGSLFQVFIPQHQEEHASPALSAQAVPRGRGEHILLIDDEPAILNAGRQILDRLGYQVSTFAHVQDALQAFRSDPQDCDLIITDQVMPRMTGLQLASEMRQVRPGLPIILISGFNDPFIQDRVRDLGINAFVEKPFTQEDLGRAIHETLHQD